MVRTPVPLQRLIGTRAGAWFFIHVAMPIDRVLMPLTGGRIRVSLTMPSGMLVCRGARSGAERRVPLVYVPLGDGRLLLVASNGGSPRHPAWYHNVRAHPDVAFAARGGERPYRARPAGEAERAELWNRAVRQYVGFETYQGRTAREIPMFVLEPQAASR